MTATRILEVLDELRRLEAMADGLRAHARDYSNSHRDWPLVIEAMEDRVALLRGVLHFEDPHLVTACEAQLASLHMSCVKAGAQDANSQASDEAPSVDVGNDCSTSTRESRPTIH